MLDHVEYAWLSDKSVSHKEQLKKLNVHISELVYYKKLIDAIAQFLLEYSCWSSIENLNRIVMDLATLIYK